MIKKDFKCPKCGKTLFRGYSPAIYSITCRCGEEIILKENGKLATENYHKRGKDNYYANKSSYTY